MRNRVAVAAFAALLAAASPSVAQDAAGSPVDATPPGADAGVQIPPEHLALAQEIIDLTQSDRAFDDILPRLATQTQTVLIRSNPSFTREIEDTVTEVAISLAQRRAELARVLQGVWARRFSVAELEELKVFFSSDVGKKFVDQTPVITALALGAAKQWEEAISQQMVNEARVKLREKGVPL
jgi:hypothetical protein